MSKTDMKRDSEKRFRNKLNRKHWRDYRLRELEKQLEFAESRCSTLKQQLDYVKVLYGCSKPSLHDNEEISESYDKKENIYINADGRRISFDDLSRWHSFAADFGDGDNAEKSFLPQTVSCTNTTRASTHSSNKLISSKSSFEKKEMIDDSKESALLKNQSKVSKGKRKKGSSKSKHKLKTKTVDPKCSNVSCQTSWPVWQDSIVEIYKNASANVVSESAADITYKSKRQKIENLKSESSKMLTCKCKKDSDSSEQLIPATKLKAFTSFKSEEKIFLKEEGIQTEPQAESDDENCELPETANPGKTSPRPYYEPEQIKGYCQPTISSKKKRVERNFLANLNLKSIPFIAATSTAPSHNIGVNIQQVLSIMKKRQPMNNNNEIFPILSDHLIGETGQYPIGSHVNLHGGNVAEANRGENVTDVAQSDSKKRLDGMKPGTAERKVATKEAPSKMKSQEEIVNEEGDNPDWNYKVHQLKKVLVFLHEDFTSLSHKYKRLQKKLFKRNINKTDAKDELIEIEKDLEKKEEEITIVIGLYKEVLHLREEVKKCQEKYSFLMYERALMMDGIKQSNSTHTQMSALLRKIQQFQDQLKL